MPSWSCEASKSSKIRENGRFSQNPQFGVNGVLEQPEVSFVAGTLHRCCLQVVFARSRGSSREPERSLTSCCDLDELHAHYQNKTSAYLSHSIHVSRGSLNWLQKISRRRFPGVSPLRSGFSIIFPTHTHSYQTFKTDLK